ncbi:MAG TPA: TolC family protein, partial [Polyangia bacterium]
ERLAGTFAGGIHLSWSLFNSFTTTLEAKRSALRAQAMRYELQRRAQSTTTEVRNAIAMLRTAKEERRFLEDALGHAVATAMLLRRRYQAGAAMLIEVTQADDVVLGLEISLVENAASIALADVSFKAAIGAI